MGGRGVVTTNGADSGAILLPDPTVIRAHLNKLFSRCAREYPNGRCEIAWSEPGAWAIANAQSFPTTPEGLAEATALSASLSAAGSNVYVGVNPRRPQAPDRGRCSAGHIEIAFFQFCECDRAESLDLLRRAPLPYSAFVITGRTPTARVHAYYELATPIRDMSVWRHRQEVERDRCRGDNVVDPPRLLRLAGTINYPAPHKASRGYKHELVEFHATGAQPISDVDVDFGWAGDGAKAEPCPGGSAGAGRPNFGYDKVAEWLARIDADDHWHDCVRDLVARLVSEGYDRRILLGLAPRLTRPGYAVGQTIAELEGFIRSAEAKYSVNGTGHIDDGASEAEDDWEHPPEAERLDSWDDGDDDAPIPPREWLLGRFFCREFVSSILGDGAIGKTAFRIACALSMAANRNLIGEPVYQRCRVLLVCFEDSRDELRRRVRAAKIHYRISNDDTRGWLRLSVVSRSDLKLARLDRGAIRKGRLGEILRREIVEYKIDVLILDPLIKTHSLPENNNEAIDYVAGLLAELATTHRIAVDAPHHVRKGVVTPGDADAGRGAVAAKNAFRLVYTMAPMSEATAALFKLSGPERRQLVRVDSGKVNIAPPSDARWYRLVSVELGNPSNRYPDGDEMAVVECWLAPDLFEGLSVTLMNAILDEIDRKLPHGIPYSDSNAAKQRAAWKVVARHTSIKTEEQCREIVRIWVRNGVLISDKYRDEKHGRDASGLRVDPEKRPR
jgi:hypothetical protein